MLTKETQKFIYNINSNTQSDKKSKQLKHILNNRNEEKLF